jgi:dethiobiotin synthetase
MSGYFITGTDTGVGKTFVTCALMQALQARGVCVAPMKPVAAGTIDVDGVPINEDVALFMRLSANRFPLRAVNPCSLQEAIAPHIAARHENVQIDLAQIQRAYRTLATQADVVLVEGAGGFLVPISDGESMALIPAALQLPVIVVVGMRLGCINHALLTVEAIRSRGLALAGWIANTTDARMNAYVENLATLQRAIDAPLLGEIPGMTAGDVITASLAAGTHLRVDALVSRAVS